MTTLSLPSQFEVERLKRYLQEYPERAKSLAIEYLQDYLELVSKFGWAIYSIPSTEVLAWSSLYIPLLSFLSMMPTAFWADESLMEKIF